MSQILGRELGGRDARFNLLLKLVKAAAERAVRCGHGRQHWGQAGTENAVVSAREEERGPQAEFGNPVAVGTRNALDQAVKMEPSQLIGHAPWADWLGTDPGTKPRARASCGSRSPRATGGTAAECSKGIEPWDRRNARPKPAEFPPGRDGSFAGRFLRPGCHHG